MSFSKISEILTIAQEKKLPFWEVILDDDMQERNASREDSFCRMEKLLDAMILADKNYNPVLKSQSGMSGGDGAKLEAFRKQNNRLIGTFLATVMEKAVKMAESNACMGRIVAAPTAGSCVFPQRFDRRIALKPDLRNKPAEHFLRLHDLIRCIPVILQIIVHVSIPCVLEETPGLQRSVDVRR